jgi:hypothetical protein
MCIKKEKREKEKVFCFFSLFVRNRVVLFCGLVAERQYNPPSS